MSVVQGPDGDEITFAGQRGIFNNISLDGGDYNNGFFGEQAGRPARADRHHARRGQGIPGHRDRRASAEFGRTAGGVVNVITNPARTRRTAALFHFQRLEALDRRSV